LLGNGDGTFSSPAYFFDDGANSIIAADLNGDGKQDIAAAGSFGLAVLLGKGNGTFQPAVFPFTTPLYGLLTADLTGDGKSDLVAGGGQVYLGNGDGTFKALAPIAQDVSVLADINGDGKPDAIGGRQFTAQYSDRGLSLGNGDGTFGPYIVVFTGSEFDGAIGFVQAADMNGDGKQDLVVTDNDTYSIVVLINTTPPPPVTNLSPSSLTFPAQNVGSRSNPVPVTLSNTGKGVLSVTGVTIGGTNANEFSQSNNCTTVQPGAKCTINVTYAPTAAGAASAAVIVTDTAGGGTQTVAVSGTGVAVPGFEIGPASGAQTSQTVSAGQSATFSLVVTPSSGFSGAVALSCSIIPKVTPAPNCSLPSSVNVTAGTAAPVKVMVSTTAPVTTGTISYVSSPPSATTFIWTMLLLTLGFLLVRRRRNVVVAAIPVMVLALASWVGCGGWGGSSSSHTTPGTPAGTYTATVGATSGSLNHTAQLTVVVQ